MKITTIKHYLSTILAVIYLLMTMGLTACNSSSTDRSTGNDSITTESIGIDGAEDNGKTFEEDIAINESAIYGVIQKGPFVRGSNITIHQLDENLKQVGQTYYTTTTNDLGSFKLDEKIKGQFVEIVAEGFYFNEFSGEVTDSYMTLRALANVSEGSLVNVNVLTTLIGKRIRYLVQEKSLAFANAQKQAQAEALKNVFGITQTIEDANTLNILENKENSDILLAVSLIVQSDLSSAEITTLMAHIEKEIEADGTIDHPDLDKKIKENAKQLYASDIAEKTKEYFGLSELPNFQWFLDNDGDGKVNQEDLTCENEKWNRFYNNDRAITLANLKTVSDTGSASGLSDTTVYSDQASTVTLSDIHDSFVIVKNASDTDLSGISDGYVYIESGDVELSDSSATDIVIDSGVTLTATTSSWNRYYVLDGATLDLSGAENSNTVYVFSGGTLIDDDHTGDHIQYEDGSQIPDVSTFAPANPVWKTDNYLGQISDYAKKLPIDDGMIAYVKDEYFASFAEMKVFNPNTLELSVQKAQCSYSLDMSIVSAPEISAQYVEHKGTLILSNTQNQDVFVQSGGVLMIADAPGSTVYAQSGSVIHVMESAVDIHIIYEDDVTIKNDSGAITLEKSAFITFE